MSKNPRSFVFLMAFLMSFMAFAIDAMLPALGQIGKDLGVLRESDNQLIISFVFLGMGVGLPLFGPLSDAWGRKNALYLGILIYLIGSLIGLFSPGMQAMLLGRFIQGFGAASCRVVSMAMVRDRFEGKEMARIMSFIIIVFILVPAVAPSFGQVIQILYGWRGIYFVFALMGGVALLWLGLGQKETLPKSKRTPFSLSNVGRGCLLTWTHPQSRGYMLVSTGVFSCLVGYITTAQPLLQNQYQLGERFTLVFGGLALVIGVSSFLNTRLLTFFSMEQLSRSALLFVVGISWVFFFVSKWQSGHPPLWMFCLFMALVFSCLGFLFGNFNALAVQPLGHIAGVATSVITSVQTIGAAFLGGWIGRAYDGTVQPLVLGFAVYTLVSFGLLVRTQRQRGI